MLGPIVVGEPRESQTLEHGRAFLGPAFLRIEGNDAPGDEILALEEPLGGNCRRKTVGRGRLSLLVRTADVAPSKQTFLRGAGYYSVAP